GRPRPPAPEHGRRGLLVLPREGARRHGPRRLGERAGDALPPPPRPLRRGRGRHPPRRAPDGRGARAPPRPPRRLSGRAAARAPTFPVGFCALVSGARSSPPMRRPPLLPLVFLLTAVSASAQAP